MPTINEMYNDENIKEKLKDKMRKIFSSNEEERNKLINEINNILGEENNFRIPPETIENFKNMVNEREKGDFINNRVDNFLSRFGEVNVDEKRFTKIFSTVEYSSKPKREETNPKNPDIKEPSFSQENIEQRNDNEWKSRYDREMEALKIHKPDVHSAINNLPEDNREQFLRTLLKTGAIKPEDVSLHDRLNEKPVQRKEEEIPDNTNPANFNNPKKSHLLNAARAIERRNEDKRYQAELSAQKARKNIRDANIRRIESGTSECLTRYSDTRIVQKHNIEDFDKECHRKISGFSEMSKADQKTALNQRLATDPELKAAHDRVVRGYKELCRYDDTMIRHLESAQNSGIDVTRNAEEYDRIKQKSIEPAKVETDEIKKARTMLDRMADRIRDAVINLMNRFGFGRKPEQEVSNLSSNISGPSNG